MGAYSNQIDHERWLVADLCYETESKIIIVEQTDRNRYVYIFK
jgi:hypothetical protein